MDKGTVIGLRPWLPWPLNRWRSWTEPVPAERLAALRIGLAAVLLVDLLWNYRPHLHDFFGRGSLGSPELFAWYGRAPRWNWSLLRGVEDPHIFDVALTIWIGATTFLLLGAFPRLSAVVVWALSVSFANLNSWIDNAGDQIRSITLFYLMLAPSGATWSLDSWWRRWRRRRSGPVFIHPWPLRLLLLQMMVMYGCNGLYKLFGESWQEGHSLYYVLNDITLARFSYVQLPVPVWLTRLLTWAVLIWELSFPLLICLRWTRTPALLFGAAFHLGIFASMELGGFAPYALCLYLPFIPWERLRRGADVGEEGTLTKLV
jgi:uncharacterized membrane protein YphA (DoxX/SURF4 family)